MSASTRNKTSNPAEDASTTTRQMAKKACSVAEIAVLSRMLTLSVVTVENVLSVGPAWFLRELLHVSDVYFAEKCSYGYTPSQDKSNCHPAYK